MLQVEARSLKKINGIKQIAYSQGWTNKSLFMYMVKRVEIWAKYAYITEDLYFSQHQYAARIS